MPSPRPVKPSRSVVVAFTPTRDRLRPQQLRQPRLHRLPVRADLRPLAEQGDVRIGQHAAARGDPPGGMAQELGAVGVLPLHLARRELPPDIALGQRPVDRVAQRVDADIGVRMALQAELAGHARRRTAPSAGRPRSGARRSRCRCAAAARRSGCAATRARSSGKVIFTLRLRPGDQRHRLRPASFQQLRIVRRLAPPRPDGRRAAPGSGRPAASARGTARRAAPWRRSARPRRASAYPSPAGPGWRRAPPASAASRPAMVPGGTTGRAASCTSTTSGGGDARQRFQPRPHAGLPGRAARDRGQRRQAVEQRRDPRLLAGGADRLERGRPSLRRSSASAAWRSTGRPSRGRYCFGCVRAEAGAAAGGHQECCDAHRGGGASARCLGIAGQQCVCSAIAA